jgi:hypothetical protein
MNVSEELINLWGYMELVILDLLDSWNSLIYAVQEQHLFLVLTHAQGVKKLPGVVLLHDR